MIFYPKNYCFLLLAYLFLKCWTFSTVFQTSFYFSSPNFHLGHFVFHSGIVSQVYPLTFYWIFFSLILKYFNFQHLKEFPVLVSRMQNLSLYLRGCLLCFFFLSFLFVHNIIFFLMLFFLFHLFDIKYLIQTSNNVVVALIFKSRSQF